MFLAGRRGGVGDAVDWEVCGVGAYKGTGRGLIGVRRCVFFMCFKQGVGWSGLIAPKSAYKRCIQ